MPKSSNSIQVVTIPEGDANKNGYYVNFQVKLATVLTLVLVVIFGISAFNNFEEITRVDNENGN
jgi:hypothetical protein